MAAVLTKMVSETIEEFIELVVGGVGKLNAALAVGWTPRQLRELETDPDFNLLMEQCSIRQIESVEQVAYELAIARSVPMIQMILYCKGADRGWRPPTQRVAVNHQGTVAVERVNAVRQAAIELMERHGPEMLAIGGPLDSIDEADVVSD